jgi:hypothetical protein
MTGSTRPRSTEGYRHCRACGQDDDGTLNQSSDGWYGADISPTNTS